MKRRPFINYNENVNSKYHFVVQTLHYVKKISVEIIIQQN